MSRILTTVVVISSFLAGGTDSADALHGVWLAESMKADGKDAPPEAVKRMRFTFKGDKLLVRGNFKENDREEEATYTIDAEQSPKQLDFVMPGFKKPVLAIYKIEGDKLTICARHMSSTKGRPTDFESKPDTELLLIVFRKQM